MKLVKPSIQFMSATRLPLHAIEKAGRTCYKSEDLITKDSAEAFVRKLLSSGHLAMIEHAWMSYRVICDRGVSHEIVRHRLFSYAQESTRYCNYKGGVTFIIPCWMDIEEGECKLDDFVWGMPILGTEDELIKSWLRFLVASETAYTRFLNEKWTPQRARSVLPNALKTEIVITGNLREWLHFFKLRTAAAAHPQMREVADMLLADARSQVPVVFEDLSKGE